MRPCAGEMNDAGEVLLTIFELINQSAVQLARRGLPVDVRLDDVFG